VIKSHPIRCSILLLAPVCKPDTISSILELTALSSALTMFSSSKIWTACSSQCWLPPQDWRLGNGHAAWILKVLRTWDGVEDALLSHLSYKRDGCSSLPTFSLALLSYSATNFLQQLQGVFLCSRRKYDVKMEIKHQQESWHKSTLTSKLLLKWLHSWSHSHSQVVNAADDTRIALACMNIHWHWKNAQIGLVARPAVAGSPWFVAAAASC